MLASLNLVEMPYGSKKESIMKKYIAALMLLVATQSFALENCLSYPVMGGVEADYRGEISEVSDVTSFAGCPAAVLVNETIVSQLVRVVDYNDEKRCVYRANSAHFMCQM